MFWADYLLANDIYIIGHSAFYWLLIYIKSFLPVLIRKIQNETTFGVLEPKRLAFIVPIFFTYLIIEGQNQSLYLLTPFACIKCK